MVLTRQQITTIAKLWIRENVDKPGWEEDFLLNICIDEAADEYAGLDGLELEVVMSVVSGQQTYCGPNLYKRVGAYVYDPADTTGNSKFPVRYLTSNDADITNPYWTTQASTLGTPDTIIENGPLFFDVYPIPDYSLTPGILIRGYGTPSDAGVNGANLWGALTDTCPLPSYMHLAVAKRAAQKRCIQFSDNPAYSDRIANLGTECDKMLKWCARKLREVNRAVRAGEAMQSGPWIGSGMGQYL